jgi:hypothetical protein
MIELLPERMRTPRVARAITSPSGILLAGAAASAAIVGGLALPAAAVAGLAAWAVRVAASVERTPRDQRIDPGRLAEPWRSFSEDARDAQRRFERSVNQSRPGPLRERLQDLARRIDDGVNECWRIACQGDSLERAFYELDIDAVQSELIGVIEDRRRRDDESLQRTQAALEAQVQSARRIKQVAADARSRLRLLNAQLDEAVARAVELSVRAADADQLSPLTEDVETLVSELESLRQALEETSGTSGTAASGTA